MKIKHINPDININDIKQKILKHDVISFDIFDTLILRPYVKPTDLFEHLDHISDKSKVWICTSYDTSGRFHTSKKIG